MFEKQYEAIYNKLFSYIKENNARLTNTINRKIQSFTDLLKNVKKESNETHQLLKQHINDAPIMVTCNKCGCLVDITKAYKYEPELCASTKLYHITHITADGIEELGVEFKEDVYYCLGCKNEMEQEKKITVKKTTKKTNKKK